MTLPLPNNEGSSTTGFDPTGITVIIPALNEQEALPLVLSELPPGLDVVVVDNGSTDATPFVARELGARVVREGRRGYGFACLAGLAAVPPAADVVVFVDGDHSDHGDELPLLVAPIRRGEADLVVGSRVLGEREPGALPPHQHFGNLLAAFLIRRLYGIQVTDLGPFRAIRRDALERMAMEAAGFRWTTEMMVKASRMGLRVHEAAVSYRRRTGRSKISGTMKGSLLAGFWILTTILRYLTWRPAAPGHRGPAR